MPAVHCHESRRPADLVGRRVTAAPRGGGRLPCPCPGLPRVSRRGRVVRQEEGAARPGRVSNGDTGRIPLRMQRRVRVRALRVQLVRQSPLPQVPGRRAGRVARRAGRGSAAGRVLPRRLHRCPRSSPRIALQNKKVSTTSCSGPRPKPCWQIAADPKHLGAEIGFLGRAPHLGPEPRTHHPHVHCVVPGGGISPDGATWVSCPPGFFLPGAGAQPALSRASSSHAHAPGVRARANCRFQGQTGPAGRPEGLRRAPCSDLRHARTGSSTPSRPSAAPRRC